MLPGVPPSSPWLSSVKAHLEIEDDHPNVVRILEILRKKEAGGKITIQEHKEFLVLNDELNSAHEFLYGNRIYPTGELVSYLKIPTREQIAAAVDWLFDADENEANATVQRLIALEQQVNLVATEHQHERWVQLAQAVGIDENHPALRKVLRMFDDRNYVEIKWKEFQAMQNALLCAMEESWKRKIPT
jgi:hypothetical protein